MNPDRYFDLPKGYFLVDQVKTQKKTDFIAMMCESDTVQASLLRLCIPFSQNPKHGIDVTESVSRLIWCDNKETIFHYSLFGIVAYVSVNVPSPYYRSIYIYAQSMEQYEALLMAVAMICN